MLAPSATRRASAAIASALLLGLTATACSKDDASSSSAPTTTAPSACAPKDGEKAAKTLLRCAEGSVAYVENQDATGTGVVIERDGERYVLTNAHVVDPFATADVTVGGERHDALDVVGIDAGADIALVGPLDEQDAPTPLPVERTVEVERGDDVYLVGFPGEISTDDPEDLETTIASGIISRTRKVKGFEQTYFQTDASIAGGQSGGPLFDAAGRLIGISGLSFADDEFALVLSGEDVDDAITRILDGDGDDYPDVPRIETDDLVTSGTVTLADASDYQQLFIPAADDDRTLEFTIAEPDSVSVGMSSNVSETPLAVSHNAPLLLVELEKLVAAARGGDPEELPDPTAYGIDEKWMKPETSPGVFSVEIPEDEDVYIEFAAPLATAAVPVEFTSNIPLFVLTADRSEEEIEVGDVVERVITTYETAADYLLTLEEGQKVEVRAESPQSDLGIIVVDPGVTLDPVAIADYESAEGVELIDDSDEGLYGYDAVTTITATAAGTYRIQLYSNDTLTVLARLSVTDCEDTKCGKGGKSDDEADDK